MTEMHLEQPGFTYSAYQPFTKNKERKEIKEAGDSWYIYQKELDKTCFQHDIAYGEFKDLYKILTKTKTFITISRYQH